MQFSLYDNRDFKLHWAGVAIAQIGSSFTAIAMPWLVLSMTRDDPLIMSTVLGAMSLPTGIFLLCGGALADRFSPWRTLLAGRIGFVVSMLSLALLTAAWSMPLWVLYFYAVALGTFIAIGIPASQALLPALVPESELGKANGVVFGTFHVAQVIGPTCAGWMIWLGRRLNGTADGAADSKSIGLAFAIDAVAVAISSVLILSIKSARVRSSSAGPASQSIFQFIREGLLFCWRESGIRMVLAYLTLTSFFLQGPLLAGLPILTKFQLGMYERALGSLYASLGLGTIVGAGLAVWWGPSPRKLGAIVLCCDLIVGLSFSILGQVGNFWGAGALLFTMGSGLGLTMVAGTTWFQQQTPGHLMGRVMSVVMFAILGLTPFSASLAGFLVEATSVSHLMGVSGIVIFCFAGIGLLIPRVRYMGIAPMSRT